MPGGGRTAGAAAGGGAYCCGGENCWGGENCCGAGGGEYCCGGGAGARGGADGGLNPRAGAGLEAMMSWTAGACTLVCSPTSASSLAPIESSMRVSPTTIVSPDCSFALLTF